jgi:hypothetical protein
MHALIYDITIHHVIHGIVEEQAPVGKTVFALYSAGPKE